MNAPPLPSLPFPPLPSLLLPSPPLPSPLLEEHSEQWLGPGGCAAAAGKGGRVAGLLMGARERWPHAPAAGTEAAMEILLIVRFCCNCTYGNPDPLSWEVVYLATSGG